MTGNFKIIFFVTPVTFFKEHKAGKVKNHAPKKAL